MCLRSYKSSLSFALLCFSFFLTFPSWAITVQGTLTSNTRWTSAQSPVILSGDLTVASGVTLTIEPGVEVRAAAGDTLRSGADTSRVELTIQGGLVAIGSSAKPIVFKGSSTINGAWYGVRILPGGSATLEHATIQYGRSCVDNYSVVAMNYVQINNCSSHAVYARSGTTTLGFGKIFQSNYGFFITGGKVKVTDSVIYRNTSYAVYASYSSSATTVEISRCTIVNNKNHGVYTYRSNTSSGAFILKDSIVARNAGGSYEVFNSRYGITCSNNLIWDSSGNTIYNRYSPACSSSVNYNPLFVDEAKDDYRIFDRSPARKAGPGGIDLGAFAWTTHKTTSLHGKLLSNLQLPAGKHILAGDLIVGHGATLTLAPGATLLVDTADDMSGGQDRTKVEIVVEGSLLVKGSKSSAVSLRSRTISNSNNLWYGVRVLAGGRSEFTHSALKNAKYGAEVYGTLLADFVDFSYSQYGVFVRSGTVSMKQSKVHHNQYGAFINGGKSLLSFVQIYRNTAMGVYASYSSSTITVEVSHCTIARNNNHGIYSRRGSSSAGPFLLKDSIVAQNAGTNYEVFGDQYGITCSNNLIWDSSGNIVYSRYAPTCSASISANPFFLKDSADDYQLLNTSPARKAGSGGSDLGALPWSGATDNRLRGRLTKDLTLPAGSHTLYGDLIVSKGVTLTLSPGATLTLPTTDDVGGGIDRSKIEIVVEGTLVAKGTASKGITFRSSSTSTSNSLWYGIRVEVGGTATLQYVTLLNARIGLDVKGTASADNSSISRTQYGAYVRSGVLNLNNSKLFFNQYGVYFVNGKAKLSYTLIYRNTSNGIYASYSSSAASFEVDHCTIAWNNSYGVYTYRSSSSSGAFQLKNSIVTRNANTSFEVYNSRHPIVCSNNLVWDVSGDLIFNRYSPPCAAAVNYSPLFVDEANNDFRIFDRSPARLAGTGGTDLGALPWTIGKQKTKLLHGRIVSNTVLPSGTHKLVGDLIVSKGVTLTLAKGAILEVRTSDDLLGGYDRSRVEVVVEGKLVAEGESDTKPIQFKSEGTTTSVNRWYGIRVLTGATLDLRFASIRSARFGVESFGSSLLRDVELSYNGSYGVYMRAGTLTFNTGKVYRNSSTGIYIIGGVTKLSFLQIYRNSSYGVYANNSSNNHTVFMDHCTIAYNGSYGVYVYRRISTAGAFTLQNSIVVRNSGSNYEVYSPYYGPICKNNLIWDVSGSTLYTRYSPACSALVRANPQFKREVTDDYNIQKNSPARGKAIDKSDLGALPFEPELAKVEIKPSLGEVRVGKTLQFKAVGIDILGGVKKSVKTFSWKVVGGGGTIDNTGLFTAGKKAGTFFSTIEATANGIAGYASVKVKPGAFVKIIVLPNPGTAPPGRTIQFSASGEDQYGNRESNLKATWRLTKGGGSINTSGLVTTQSQNGTFTNSVEATYGSLKGLATLVVDSTFPVVTTVEVTPSKATLKFKEQKSFTAVAKDQSGKVMTGLKFTWSASGGGTVLATSSSTSDFIAGSKAGSYTLTAQTAGVKGQATLAVVDPNAGVLGSIAVTPSLATIKVGQTQQFTAQAYDKNGKPIAIKPTWSAGGGSIDSKGLFKAAAVPGTFQVSAVSNNVTGRATIQIQPGTPPTAPKLLTPKDKALTKNVRPVLTVSNSTDPDKDKLSYDFFVATDAQFTNVVAQANVPETPNTTSWQVSKVLKDNTTYYWRVRATDGILRSVWSTIWKFELRAQNAPPSAPELSTPTEASQVTETKPTLVVKNAKDPEGLPLLYSFEVATDAAMTQVVAKSSNVKEGGGTTSWKLTQALKNKTTYFWRAWAVDNKGLSGPKMKTASFSIALANSPPTAPKPKSPADQGTTSSAIVTLEVENATDPDGDPLTYHFQISEDKSFQGPLDEQQGTSEGASGTTSWKPKALARGKTYFWRARASDGTLDGPWSDTVSFQVDVEPSSEVASESPPGEASKEVATQETSDAGASVEKPARVEKQTQEAGDESVVKDVKTAKDSAAPSDSVEPPGGCGCAQSSEERAPFGPWILCFLAVVVLSLVRKRVR